MTNLSVSVDLQISKINSAMFHIPGDKNMKSKIIFSCLTYLIKNQRNASFPAVSDIVY